jgi:hypothetical protein
MSEMELDVGPGRGYRYYNGPVLFPFGAPDGREIHRLHYTLRPSKPADQATASP